ncbi:hypothetical protein B296_00029694 [Ensete ventricosum]|uniref:Uncharacterized protein n=1 Tax=Ensete ventricosum TaxID=4639 RepID=A0A426ZBC2_ENSVE|nr:hypothetical protein B296_00029694 [Ensete ventricosum]
MDDDFIVGDNVASSTKGEIISYKVGGVAQRLKELCKAHRDEGSFEAYAPYLRDAFDRVTKVIQLTEVKLGSGDLSMRQEDEEAGVTQEWVDDGELPREQTKIGDGEGLTKCWQRPHMEKS